MNKKILISGFEPFDRDATNPSGDWITWIKSRPEQKNEIEGVILPVTFSGGFLAFKKVFDEFCPDYVILTGLAKNRTQLTVERIGINWVDARIPDNNGVMIKAQKIDELGADGLFTTIPFEVLVRAADSFGVDLKLSTSAGEYVCNELLYRVLSYTKDKKTKVTFIHMPGSQSYDGIYLALEAMINAL